MHRDATAPIIAAARKRHELTRAKAIQALRELDRTGAPITFKSVSDAAGVSRSWLYGQPGIRAEIQRLRDVTRRAPVPAIPASQRTSEASALARLDTALTRNRELSQDNQRLRRQLAQPKSDACGRGGRGGRGGRWVAGVVLAGWPALFSVTIQVTTMINSGAQDNRGQRMETVPHPHTSVPVTWIRCS